MSNKENNEFNNPNMKEKCETHKMENENYNYADNRNINPNYADYENAIKGETVSVSKRWLKTAVAGVLIFAVAGGSGFAVGRVTNHGPGMDGTVPKKLYTVASKKHPIEFITNVPKGKPSTSFKRVLRKYLVIAPKAPHMATYV